MVLCHTEITACDAEMNRVGHGHGWQLGPNTVFPLPTGERVISIAGHGGGVAQAQRSVSTSEIKLQAANDQPEPASDFRALGRVLIGQCGCDVRELQTHSYGIVMEVEVPGEV